MNSPKKTLERGEELQKKIYDAVMDNSEDIIAAVRNMKSSMDNTGEETDEQFIGAVIKVVISTAAAAAVEAGVEAAIKRG
ncbi:hypothetical protein V5799_020011 [Amblyomma americanum]|uniref:Uncharacterized protein n=1 Tax=Amblyomma americanum TaxID=6943 RepID=A0AAQ4EV38_AMBAM